MSIKSDNLEPVGDDAPILVQQINDGLNFSREDRSREGWVFNQVTGEWYDPREIHGGDPSLSPESDA